MGGVGPEWTGKESNTRAFFLSPRRVTTSSRRDRVGDDGGDGGDGVVGGDHRSAGSNSSRSRGRCRHLETTTKRAGIRSGRVPDGGPATAAVVVVHRFRRRERGSRA